MPRARRICSVNEAAHAYHIDRQQTTVFLQHFPQQKIDACFLFTDWDQAVRQAFERRLDATLILPDIDQKVVLQGRVACR